MQRYFSSCLTHSPAFLPPWASLVPGPLLQMFAGHKASDLPKTSIPAFPPASTCSTCLSRGGPESRIVCPIIELMVLLPLAPSRFPFLTVKVWRFLLASGDGGIQEQMHWTRACLSCSRAPAQRLGVHFSPQSPSSLSGCSSLFPIPLSPSPLSLSFSPYLLLLPSLPFSPLLQAYATTCCLKNP